jgi:hypothetical protein
MIPSRVLLSIGPAYHGLCGGERLAHYSKEKLTQVHKRLTYHDKQRGVQIFLKLAYHDLREGSVSLVVQAHHVTFFDLYCSQKFVKNVVTSGELQAYYPITRFCCPWVDGNGGMPFFGKKWLYRKILLALFLPRLKAYRACKTACGLIL